MTAALRRGDVVELTRPIRVAVLWGFGSRVAVPAGTRGVVTAGPAPFRSPIVRFDGGASFSCRVDSLKLIEGAGHSPVFSWLL